MSRFLLLIRNEWIKIMKKPLHIGMLIGLVLLTVGYMGVLKLVGVNQADNGGTSMDFESQIAYYETEQPDGYEAELERLYILLENDIDLSVPSWRLHAADQTREAVRLMVAYENSINAKDMIKATVLRESIEQDKELIRRNDWVGYYEKKIDEVGTNPELSEESREELLWQYQYVLDYAIAADENSWKFSLYDEILNAMQELAEEKLQEEQGVGVNRERTRALNEIIQINEYRIENGKVTIANVDEDPAIEVLRTKLFADTYEQSSVQMGSGYWFFFRAVLDLLPLFTLVLIVIAGGIISSEFSTGTIRLLFSHGVKRERILLSKITMLLLAAVGMLGGLFLLSGLFAGLFNGFGDAGAGYLYVSQDAVHEVNGFLAMAVSFLCELPGMIAFAVLALSLSALTRSTAVSVCVSAFFLFAGDSIVTLTKYWNQDWGRYLLFANLDLENIRLGNVLFYGQNVWISLLVIAVYAGLCLLTAWDAFIRRDVD